MASHSWDEYFTPSTPQELKDLSMRFGVRIHQVTPSLYSASLGNWGGRLASLPADLVCAVERALPERKAEWWLK